MVQFVAVVGWLILNTNRFIEQTLGNSNSGSNSYLALLVVVFDWLIRKEIPVLFLAARVCTAQQSKPFTAGTLHSLNIAQI